MLVKKLFWMGDSKGRLKEFPDDVRRDMGYALDFAEKGDKHPTAKPLKGLGGVSRLLEIQNRELTGSFMQ